MLSKHSFLVFSQDPHRNVAVFMIIPIFRRVSFAEDVFKSRTENDSFALLLCHKTIIGKGLIICFIVTGVFHTCRNIFSNS